MNFISIGDLSRGIVRKKTKGKVLVFPDGMTPEARTAMETEQICAALWRLAGRHGAQGATRIGVLLLLELSRGQDLQPNLRLYKQITELAACFKPDQAA